jgi:hypothetical protein
MRAAGAARRGGTWWAAQSGAGSGARTGRAMCGRIERRRGRRGEPASVASYCRESGAGLCFSTVAVIRRLRAAAGGGSREWRWRERVRDGWRSVGRHRASRGAGQGGACACDSHVHAAATWTCWVLITTAFNDRKQTNRHHKQHTSEKKSKYKWKSKCIIICGPFGFGSIMPSCALLYSKIRSASATACLCLPCTRKIKD